MGSRGDARPQLCSSPPLPLLCAIPDTGSAPRGSSPPIQVALTPGLGPLHYGEDSSAPSAPSCCGWG